MSELKTEKLDSILLADVQDIDSMQYLLEGLFLKSGLIGIVGTSDVGKSSFIRQLLISVGNGANEFLGHKLNIEHCKSLYVTSEDSPTTVKHLMKLQATILNEGLEFLYSIRIISETDELIKNLNKHFKQERFDIVVIDTYADIFTGDINRANEVRGFLKPYNEIADKYNCLIIFLHHIGKGKQNLTLSKDNVLGSQAFESKMRAVIELSTDKNNILKRYLNITKGNYFSPEEKQKGWGLRFEDRCFFYEGEEMKVEPKSKDNSLEKESKIIEMLKAKKPYTEIQTILKVSPSKITAIKKANNL